MATAIRPSAALMEETREEEASSLLSSDSRDLDSHGAVETSRGYAVRNASAVKYSSEELEGASLFAGLSFPEPPSHRPYVAPAGRTASSGPPVVSPPATAPALPTRTVPFDASKVQSVVSTPPPVRSMPAPISSAKEESSQVLTVEAKDTYVGSWRSSALSGSVSAPMHPAVAPELTQAPSQAPVQQHIATPEKLTSLYSTESSHTAVGSDFYPSLPDAPTLAKYVPNTERTEVPLANSPLVVSQQETSPVLVNDLLDENTRLRRELEALRRDPMPPAIPQPSAMMSSGANSLGRVPTISNPTPPTIQQQISRPQQQTAVGHNPPSSQHTKYVCCGGCRQWLAAPRDANLVYCAQCQCVNDCSMSPETARNYNIVQANRQDTTPWYISCFKEFFS